MSAAMAMTDEALALATTMTSDRDVAPATVEGLVHAHSALVFKIAYSVLRNADDAEDAVQDTFLRVLRQEKALAGVEDRRAWLARIAWRVACDRVKARRANVSDDEALAVIADPRASADERLAREQQIALVQAMVAKLPTDLREVVQLSTVQEMTSADVAAVLGIPEGSVRTRLMRAREVLKQKVAAVTKRQF